GHFRKGTKTPCIVHPLAVAKTLIEAGCPEDGVVAGILHDTVEDTPVSLDEVRHRFGQAVARIVEGASEPDKSKPWEERKAHTIESLKTAPEGVLLVSCADKIENLNAIREDRERVGEAVWGRFRRGRDHQAWYYRSVLAVLAGRLTAAPGLPLVHRLRRAVEDVFG
ncbi:MAG TPA: HD domain-containing protein, partial [Syntrophales bacterium]|nr:HD domain-containing protein [Syntrophales bacterium]